MPIPAPSLLSRPVPLRRRPGLRVALALCLMFAGLSGIAARKPAPLYSYGEAWWWQPQADKGTTLLLPFSAPEVTASAKVRDKAVTVRTQAAKEDAMFSLEGIEAAAEAPALPTVDLGDMTFSPKPIVRDGAAAATLFDYGWRRREFSLTDSGLARAPEGRWGAGLACDGRGALTLRDVRWGVPEEADPRSSNSGESLDFWIRIAAYPTETSPILEMLNLVDRTRPSADTAGAKLLLHPDGRLELALRHPHGMPSANAWSAEKLREIEATPAEIVSRSKLPLNEWVHIRCFNDPPVVQGAGAPFQAVLAINGMREAAYLSEVNNSYNFLGRIACTLVLGNDLEGTGGFVGTLDEVRLMHERRAFYPRLPMPWRDADGSRPMRFDKPYFLEDGTTFYASADTAQGLTLDRVGPAAGAAGETVQWDLQGAGAESVALPGVRREGWLIDPEIGFPKLPTPALKAATGTLEFWLRPENFDNYTSRWPDQPEPPSPRLSVLRLVGRDATNGSEQRFLEVRVPRVRLLDQVEPDLQPGEWIHLAVRWKNGRADLFRNGKHWQRAWLADPATLARISPLYAEFGVTDDVTVLRGARPRIAVDEIVGYTYALTDRELNQAAKRVQAELKPLPLFDVRVDYRRSIGKLLATVTAQLPETITPSAVRLVARAKDAPADLGLNAEFRADLTAPPPSPGPAGYIAIGAYPVSGMQAVFVLAVDQALPSGTSLDLDVTLLGADGKALAADTRSWTYEAEPWYGNTLGELAADAPPPAPWTPLELRDAGPTGAVVSTRMTTYTLGAGGLPTQIVAAGEPLLAAPVALLEDGAPMQGTAFKVERASPNTVVWRGTYTGKTCRIEARFVLDYDGTVRHELQLIPTAATVSPVRLEWPMRPGRATNYMVQWIGEAGMQANRVPAAGLTTVDRELWLANRKREKAKEPALDAESFEAYGFWPVADLNDRDRGLYWFADNAAGWAQSKRVRAQSIEVADDAVRLVCRLVAEPTAMAADVARPLIVFGVLPHPARPLPSFTRTLDRVSPEQDPLYCVAYGNVFRPWPLEPRDHNMALYPAVDPDAPEAGPSVDFAKRAAAKVVANNIPGFRMLYLSKYWLKCRAGSYDGWEWRDGPTHQATITPAFTEYLSWELDQWFSHDVFNGVYMDDNYGTPSLNVEAGHAVLLPDGSIQPGERNWDNRALFKRWRQLFHDHDLPPMFLTHLTRGFPYHCVVFCDSYLDGEGHPTITAASRDFVDSLALERAEVLQNGQMWGVAPFFMPSIWEGDLAAGKGYNPHPRWSWRMARGAYSVLGHFDNGMTYQDQGSEVGRDAWQAILKWGGADLAKAPLTPYWHAAPQVQVESTGAKGGPVADRPAANKPPQILASYYRRPGSLLLLVSNRATEARDVTLKLDLAALGLPPTASAHDADPNYAGPDALDIPSTGQVQAMQQQAEAGMEVSFDDKPADDLDLGAVLAEVAATEKADAGKPSLKGGLLRVNLRAHDFRLIRVE